MSQEMIPTCAPPKLPKAVKAAQAELLKLGFDLDKITAESVKKLSANQRNLARASMVQALAPKVKDDYAKLGSDELRREWLAAYLVDPHTAVSSGVNKTTAVDQTLNT